MKKLIFLLLFLYAVGAFYSCGYQQKDFEALQNKNKELMGQVKKLSDENKSLLNEVESYKNAPEKLLFFATNAYETNNMAQLKDIQEKIRKYHPSSGESGTIMGYVNKLEKAEKNKIEKEKNERLASLKKLKRSRDDVSGITWYNQPYFTHSTRSNRTSVYIGESSSNTWLCLRMSYNGSDWIFFKNAYLSYDGNTKEIVFNENADKKNDNYTDVWEWIDITIEDDLILFLRKLIHGKDIKMRLSGKYTKTRNLTTAEVNGIKDIISGYDILISEKSKQ